LLSSSTEKASTECLIQEHNYKELVKYSYKVVTESKDEYAYYISLMWLETAEQKILSYFC